MGTPILRLVSGYNRVATTNLLLNSSLEISGAGAFATSGTNIIYRTNSKSKYGLRSMQSIYQDNTDLLHYTYSSGLFDNTTYTVSCWLYVPSDWDGGNIRIEQANFTSAISTYKSIYTDGTSSTDEWIRLVSTFDFATDATGSFVLRAVSAPSADIFVFSDAWQVEEGAQVTEYCDGDQPGCYWNGTAHNSTSSRDASTRESVSLLGPQFYLKDHVAQAAQYKEGGTYTSSPFSDGRYLIDTKYDNVIDTYTLGISGLSQDGLYASLRKIRRLLIQATEYWITHKIVDPVWIEARSSNETNIRYAIIHNGTIAEEGNPWAQPFLQPGCNAVMDNINLVIERCQWFSHPPGEGVEVPLSAVEPFDTGLNIPVSESVSVSSQSTATIIWSTDDVWYETAWIGPSYTFQLHALTNDIGCMANCGFANEVTRDIGIRFQNVQVPQGATVNSATLYFTPSVTNSTSVTFYLYGHDVDNSATFSTIGDYQTRQGQFTTAGVDPWNPGTWTADVETSVSVTSIAQEIVNRGGWNSGNAMTFFMVDSISNSVYRSIYAYDHLTVSKHPRLVISWS